jgi:hypothetical protein
MSSIRLLYQSLTSVRDHFVKLQKVSLSRMNKIRSFANNPKLDRHENPKRAKVKKTPAKDRGENWISKRKIELKDVPNLFWNPAISLLSENKSE